MLHERSLTYQVLDVVDASGSSVGLDPVCAANLNPLLTSDACTPRLPTVSEDDDTRAEGGSAQKTRAIRDVSHDRFGNVTESIDAGDDAITSDDLDETSAYQNDTTAGSSGAPTSVQVFAAAGGTLLRSRTGNYDAPAS